LSDTKRFVVLLFLGSFLLQVAWIVALPPFRGIDEFDHAYRAASVASGQWRPSGELAQDGRGELVDVPASLVRDAEPVCSSMPYTGPDNCRPVAELGDGQVSVASAAARYNPVYYWLIGTPARAFDGADSLYVMRLTSALICSALLAAVGWITASWARTRWPKVGLIAAMTPVAVYSTAVPAPNGVEILAGLGVWASLLGVLRADQAGRNRYLFAAAAFAAPLAGVRGLGPVWLALIGACFLVLLTPRGALGLIRSNRAAVLTFAAVSVVSALAASLWTMSAQSLELEDYGEFTNPVGSTLKRVPLWFLQAVAAFPTRNEPAPTIVYATGGVVVVALLVAGFRAGVGQTRVAIAFAVGLSLMVPIALEIHAYPVSGAVWQGRYGWPFTAGVVLLCAYALDNRPIGSRWEGPVLATGGVMVIVAHVVSVTNVLVDEGAESPLSGDSRWLVLPPWLVILISAGGVITWLLSLWTWDRNSRETSGRIDESASIRG
jgi:hypothetical protein